jgi:Na+/pantothenate symporter
LHIRGLRSHYRHKDRWSWFVGICIAAMLIFQMFLLGFVGAGVWDFHEYDWLLPALMVQNLGQIVALATIVVRSLFRSD